MAGSGAAQPDCEEDGGWMKSSTLRRRLWLPLLLLIGVSLIVVAAFFRWIGLGEIALFLSVVALVVAVESIRYVVKQFLKGYRRGPSDRIGRP